MGYQTMQNWILPDEKDEETESLYFRKTGNVIFDEEKKIVWLGEDGCLDFSTYFNGLFLGQWKRYTNYKNIRFRIRYKGDLQWKVAACKTAEIEEEWETELKTEGQDTIIELPEFLKTQGNMLCYLKVKGGPQGGQVESVTVEGILDEPWEVKPAVAICTYRREEFVKRNIERIRQMDDTCRPEIYLVDNGGTLGEEKFPEFITYVKNKNTGGTGGFTRGILEVLQHQSEKSYTHIILMDDDIVLNTGVFEKTWMLLRGLKEEYRKASLAGSILRLDEPCIQYECGARWNVGKIKALHHHLNLTQIPALLENAEESEGEYGGWWYCCFSLDAIREKGLPLPFFVHRDDIEYGMRMGKIITMNGIGVWHEAFEEKLPQTGEYYDLRNLAILNSIYEYPNRWDRKEWTWMLRKYIAGNLLRGRYHYAMLNLLGARDFLKGAAWFKNADAVALHKKLGSRLTPLIAYEDITKEQRKHAFLAAPGVSVYKAMKKKKIFYQDSAGKCLATDKNVFLAAKCIYELLRVEKLTRRYFDRAAKSYRTQFNQLTSEDFWEKYLEIEKHGE